MKQGHVGANRCGRPMFGTCSGRARTRRGDLAAIFHAANACFGGQARSILLFPARICDGVPSRCCLAAPGHGHSSINRQGPYVQVLVRDNNVDQALRALKKKMQREGIFREMKMRNHYEKPSEKRNRQKAEAVRRARKLARKRAQREGLPVGRMGR